MKKILYFTDDFGLDNQAFAKKHGLIIRNASAYKDNDFLEKCDAVYGKVPQAYLDKYPLHKLATDEPKAEAEPKAEPKAEPEKPKRKTKEP